MSLNFYKSEMSSYNTDIKEGVRTAGHGTGMEWNGKWNGMERKFQYGIWKMPEWNGMEDFKNGMADNFPYCTSIPIPY